MEGFDFWAKVDVDCILGSNSKIEPTYTCTAFCTKIELKKIKQIGDVNYPKLIALSKLKILREIWEPVDDDDDDDVCIYWKLQRHKLPVCKLFWAKIQLQNQTNWWCKIYLRLIATLEA
jgi:hypothetical protein